jgi:small subunit ribosomal protein S21
MATVNLRQQENFEKLIRRFKKSCDIDNIIQDVRNREFFEKDSTKKRKQKKSAIKRQSLLDKKSKIKQKLY